MAEGMLIEALNKLESLAKEWHRASEHAHRAGDNKAYFFKLGGASALDEAQEEIMELVGMKPVDVNHKAQEE